MALPLCRLYLITPPRLDDLAGFGRTLAHALDAGDVAALQIRLKDQPQEIIAAAVDVFMPIAQARGVAVILNDDPTLAKTLGCDGVHIGQADMPLVNARRMMGNDAMIGVTCHDSLHLAMEAAEGGADYVAFGAFFPTDTKDGTAEAEPDILQWWSDLMELPVVAIGGINAGNCAPLVKAGANFLAVIGAVWNHPDGAAAGVRAMHAAIATA